MAAEPQRVVVIVDASKDVCAKAIKKALIEICPQTGAQLILIAILDQLSNPMGCTVWVHTNQINATTNQNNAATDKIVEKELARKRDAYCRSKQFMTLRNYCETTKMEFHIDVVARPFIEVASDAAKSLGATWLIIDRQVNKEKRQLDKLPCGMYRIRSNNSIQKLRDPKVATKNFKSHTASQDIEIITGYPDKEFSPKRRRSSPSEQVPSTGTSSSSTLMKDKEQEKDQNIEQETASIFNISDPHEQQRGDDEVSQMETEYTNPLCSVCKNKRPKVGWKKDFSYTELFKATQGFSQKNFLSEGGSGSVYKAKLEGITIAVKILIPSAQGQKEFKSEVSLLSRARHENVIMLLGSCSERKHWLLVYEYVCNGSLDQHLSQHSRIPLSWEERIKVAIGVAKGLLYLHENNIIHRDVRPNNILITHDRQTLLGDFGLARNQHEDTIHCTEVVGILEYLAPEYSKYGELSAKTDVYSFGLVLLELITGMRATDRRLKGKSLVGWARQLLKYRKYCNLIDERIIDSHDFHQLFWMVRIAEKCLSRNPQKRLNMIAVVNALSHIVEGNTGIIPRDLSPARSESLCSSLDSDESEDVDEEALSTNSTSCNSMKMMGQIIGRLPPPPPTWRTAPNQKLLTK